MASTLYGEFKMSEPKQGDTIYGFAAARVLIACVGVVVTIGSSANAQTTNRVGSPASRDPTTSQAPSNFTGLAFSEDFKSQTSYKERVDYGWSGE